MSTLLLQIPLNPPGPLATYGHVWLDSASHSPPPTSAPAPLALLPRPGRKAGVVALVPACKLSWQQVRLPAGLGRSGARLQAALNGLLEDRLLQDISLLHLALPARWTPGESTWVAVCDKAWLQAHLQALHEAGLSVQRIVPALAPHPEVLTWQATGDNTTELTRHGPQALASDWDLAQFDLHLRRRAQGANRLRHVRDALLQQAQWRAARWGLLALLAAQLAGWNAWAWTTRQHWQAQENQWTTWLQQSFPEVTVVVDAPLQMAREVARRQQQAGELGPQDLEAQLMALGVALPTDAPNLSRLSYQEGTLQWPAAAMNVAQKSAFEQALQTRGYRLQQQGEIWRLQPRDALELAP